MQISKQLPSKAAEFLFDQVAMTHRFVVEIDESTYNFGSWTKVSGLNVSWAKHVYRHGQSNHDTVLPGVVSYQNIVLARAACSDTATVKRWLGEVPRARQRLSGAIQMLDFTGLPIVTWELTDFFPIQWSISGFDAMTAKPAVEELHLAHSGFLDNDGLVG